MRHRAATLLLLGSLLLAGCGLRGPLYLPEDSSRTQNAARTTEEKPDPARPAPAPQAQKRDRTATGDTAAPAN